MRGIFTAGVLDYLMEQHVEFEYVIGDSAGAGNAINFVAGQIGRTRDCIVVDDPKLRYIHMSPKHLLTGKVFDMDLLTRKYALLYVPFDFHAFFDSPVNCEIVVTDARTGKARYLTEREDRKRLLTICAASCSMPLINEMVKVDGRISIDGGIADFVPLHRAEEMGYRKHVVVLTRPAGYRKENRHKMDFFYRKKYRAYPKLIETLTSREQRYNDMMDELDRREEDGEIFVIRPKGPVVEHTEQDREKLLDFYKQGRDIMEERFDELMAYLA